MTPQYYVGIDLGGTAIKLALVSMEGNIVYQSTLPTEARQGGDSILYRMTDMLGDALKAMSLSQEAVKGIGIGTPGFMDIHTGLVHEAVNLGWKQYPLREKLSKLTGLPVFVDNDANCAALGEMWKGAGAGAKDLLCMTLGTGVGGGVILNGQIYHGAKGTAGEIGHMSVKPEQGFRCNCGKLGCLETITSATGIVRLALDALTAVQGDDRAKSRSSRLSVVLKAKGSLEAKDVLDAAREGDLLALEIVDQVAYYLGFALGNYTVLFNPEIIVIGGGVSQAGNVLFQPIRKQYRQFALPHLTGDIQIVPAVLGNNAGVIGAAWLVHTAEETNG